MNAYSEQNNEQTQIDFRTLPVNVPSLCIPRVFSNIGENRIRKVINELHMGDIERIDIVNKSSEKGEKFNRVFIHFKKWFNEGNAAIARERLINGKDIKIVYDEPWFWKVSAYVQPKPRQYEPKKPKKPSFLFDSDKNDITFTESQKYNNRKPMKMNREQREEQREEQVKKHEKKVERVFEPRSPSTSPPPQVEKEPSEVPLLNYGNITMPKRRTKAHYCPKPKLQIVDPADLDKNEEEEEEEEERAL